jgi:hypothetical protein
MTFRERPAGICNGMFKWDFGCDTKSACVELAYLTFYDEAPGPEDIKQLVDFLARRLGVVHVTIEQLVRYVEKMYSLGYCFENTFGEVADMFSNETIEMFEHVSVCVCFLLYHCLLPLFITIVYYHCLLPLFNKNGLFFCRYSFVRHIMKSFAKYSRVAMSDKSSLLMIWLGKNLVTTK